MNDINKLDKERAFHDQRFGEGVDQRAKLLKYYSVNKHLEEFYTDTISEICQGKELLEYGCGRGERSRKWVRLGAEVTGIDISSEGIRKARKRSSNGDYRANYFVMDAANTTFDGSTFDIVVGSGIIHHLDLRESYQELSRILKKNGHIVFSEPLGSNPVINLYRALTPKMRTEDEHPLREKDIKLLSEYFHNVEAEYFTLFTLLAVPFRKMPIFIWLLGLLASIDQIVFRVPFLKRFAWMVVIHAYNPRM
jgi:2-polyprenyl-3-methyl-5-hydroxy-6-metoxy-1,4-benzoquinol methylase